MNFATTMMIQGISVLNFCSKFIIDKYGYTQTQASYAAGAVYFVSMLSPFVGLIIVSFTIRFVILNAFFCICYFSDFCVVVFCY